MLKPENEKVTTSYLINLAEKLEIKSSEFYNHLSEIFDDKKDIFQSFADESKKNKTILLRTYRETISDALETGFSFQGFELNKFNLEIELKDEITESEALKTALVIEDNASTFYLKASEASGSLLATITRALRRISEKREKRKNKISLMIQALDS